MGAIWIGLIVTAAFIALGIFGNALARSDFGWKDFCLGLEGALAALSGAGVYGFELFNKAAELQQGTPEFKAAYDQQHLNYGFLIAALVAYVAVATFHMKWDKPKFGKKHPYWQKFCLLVVANGFGLAALATFII